MVQPLGFVKFLRREFRLRRHSALQCRAKLDERGQSGSFTAELPVVLLVLFLFLAFPLLNLATTSLRAYFLRSAVLQAAHNAAKACDFDDDLPAEEGEPACPSAKTRVTDTLNAFQASFGSGVTIGTPSVYVVQQPIAGGTPTNFLSGVPKAQLNEEANTYFIEVSVEGQANPLLPMSGTIVPQVPGLTGPMNLKLSGREMFEQVEGLIQNGT